MIEIRMVIRTDTNFEKLAKFLIFVDVIISVIQCLSNVSPIPKNTLQKRKEKKRKNVSQTQQQKNEE